MNILYITYPDYIYTSGIIWNQVFTLLNKMCRQEPKLRVSLVCFVPLPQWLKRRRRHRLIRKYLHPNIELWSFPAFLKRSWIAPLMPLFAATTLPLAGWVLWRRQPSLIHARGILAGLIASWLGRRRPWLLDLRGLFPEEGVKLKFWTGTSASFRFWKRKEKDILRNATAINYISEQMEANYAPCQVQEKGGVIPSGVDTESFLPAESSPGSKPSQYCVVYSGSLGWGSLTDLQTLFRTLKTVKPNAQLLILLPYGHKRTEKREAQEELSQLFAASEFRLDQAWPEEMPRQLAQAQAGLLFRKSSIVNTVAWPTKCLEYWACGLPILTNGGVPAVDEVIQKEKIGVILTLTSEEEDQVRLVHFFANEKQLRDRCRHIAEKFSLENTANLYLSRYRRLITNSAK